jgi:integrase/recombinase XerD
MIVNAAVVPPAAKTLKRPTRAIAAKAVAKRPVKPAAPAAQTGMQLYTADGGRKYLTTGERDAFLRQAELADRSVRTLCMTLAYAGCRLSEALALTADRVDLAAGVLVFEGLKKRRTGIFCSVPVPPALLDMVHGVREIQTRSGMGKSLRLWPWSRMTGWRAVHAVMQAARLNGCVGFPKGTAARVRGGRGDRRDPA